MKISAITTTFNPIKTSYKNASIPLNFGLNFKTNGKDGDILDLYRAVGVEEKEAKKLAQKRTVYTRNNVVFDNSFFTTSKSGRVFCEKDNKNFPYTGTIKEYEGDELVKDTYYSEGQKFIESFLQDGKIYKEKFYPTDENGKTPDTIRYFDEDGKVSYIISRNTGKDWLNKPFIEIFDDINGKKIHFSTTNENDKNSCGNFEVVIFDKEKDTTHLYSYFYSKNNPDENVLRQKDKLPMYINELSGFKGVISENEEYKKTFAQAKKLNECIDIILNQMETALEN